MAVLRLVPASGISVFPWLSLTPVRNRGISFGLFSSGVLTVPVIVVSVVVLLALVLHRRARASRPPSVRFGMGMIAAGICGNLIDRVYRGGVVDFLDFRVWPVFNLADSLIVTGVFLLLFLRLTVRHAS